MILKGVVLFLAFMAVLAMFGRLRMPRLPRPDLRRRLGATPRCKRCGTPIPGGGDCPCQDRRS